MSGETYPSTRPKEQGDPWRQAAARAALVGAIFTGLVLMLSLANLVYARSVDPATPMRIDMLKTDLAKQPGNTQIQAEIRRLIDAFVEAIKENVADEETRDRVRRAILAALPQEADDGTGEPQDALAQ